MECSVVASHVYYAETVGESLMLRHSRCPMRCLQWLQPCILRHVLPVLACLLSQALWLRERFACVELLGLCLCPAASVVGLPLQATLRRMPPFLPT